MHPGLPAGAWGHLTSHPSSLEVSVCLVSTGLLLEVLLRDLGWCGLLDGISVWLLPKPGEGDLPFNGKQDDPVTVIYLWGHL